MSNRRGRSILTLSRQFLPNIWRIFATLSCIAITVVALDPILPYLEIQTIALLYLLPVILSTVLWGLAPGVLAGFAAFLVFNYFYIKPYQTLRVHQTQDIITLVIFLFVAVVTSQFLGKARRGVQMARNREREATRMYELISSLASQKEIHDIARELAHQTLVTFQFDHVQLLIASTGEKVSYTSGSDDLCLPNTPTMTCPLETARGVEGEARFWHKREALSIQETRLLTAFLSQGALALERIRLTRGENKARILEESDQMKSSLLNSVSHELRTPLSVIKASVSSLRSGNVQWNTAAREDLLASIEEETDHLNFLVGNLLDMSRIEAGALNPQKRWNEIGEIAIGVAAKMRKQLVNHRLEMSLSRELPLVPTDFVMIEQVFVNLFGNCIKYAPVNTSISVDAIKEGDYLHITVANQGPHVPEEHLAMIFEKFHRVTEADRITGTGLGLSICKGIIDAHGGKIWAENDENRFVFHFKLPLTLNGSLPKIPEELTDE